MKKQLQKWLSVFCVASMLVAGMPSLAVAGSAEDTAEPAEISAVEGEAKAENAPEENAAESENGGEAALNDDAEKASGEANAAADEAETAVTEADKAVENAENEAAAEASENEQADEGAAEAAEQGAEGEALPEESEIADQAGDEADEAEEAGEAGEAAAEAAEESAEEAEEAEAEETPVPADANMRVGGSVSGTVRSSEKFIVRLTVEKAEHVNVAVAGADVRLTVQNETTGATSSFASKEGVLEAGWDAKAGTYLLTFAALNGGYGAFTAKVVNDAALTSPAATVKEAEADGEEAANVNEEAEAETAEEEAEAAADGEEAADANEEAEAETAEEEAEAAEDEEAAAPDGEENAAEDAEANLSVSFVITWDSENPTFGDTAHFIATLEGFEGLIYTLQWQWSPDNETWYDVEGENALQMDRVIDQVNNEYLWRIKVDFEYPEAEEEAAQPNEEAPGANDNAEPIEQDTPEAEAPVGEVPEERNVPLTE